MPSHLPLLPLPPGQVLFPALVLSIQIASKASVALLQSLLRENDGAPGNKPLVLGCVPCKPSLVPDADEGSIALPLAAPPTVDDLFEWGTAAKIIRLERSSSGFAAVVEGISRFRIQSFTSRTPFFEANIIEIAPAPIPAADAALVPALQETANTLLEALAAVAPLGSTLARRLKAVVASLSLASAAPVVDILVASVPIATGISLNERLSTLATSDPVERVKRGIEVLALLTETLGVKKQIGDRVDARKREFLLLQQLAAIRDELQAMAKKDPESIVGQMRGAARKGAPAAPSEDEVEEDDIAELERAVKSKAWTEESRKIAYKELKRLKKSPPQGAEHGVIRTYLEVLLAIPWVEATPVTLSTSFILAAKERLDADHYGMDKVKKRLIEWLSVLRLKQEQHEDDAAALQVVQPTHVDDAGSIALTEPATAGVDSPLSPLQSSPAPRKSRDRGPILLLAGPPGTGKTSIAQSLADSMGRKFERISLGGVRDESEIRGHRRTYVGAMPGAIAMALRRAGVCNPVILLDEIDKLGSSSTHGDPSAALLEVLDPNQNHSFQDHYLGIPLDLSSVLFIATANSLETISEPLYDRMEVISLDGYIFDEKLQIARRYLLDKQLKANGLPAHLLTISDPVLLNLITSYTREAGVRSLEREIGAVCRAKAVEYSLARDRASSAGEARTSDVVRFGYKVDVEQQDLERILGVAKFDAEVMNVNSPVGVSTGLAYQGSGNGGILHIESSMMPGSGGIKLTGQLGEVISESAQLAISWVKSHASELGISRNFSTIDIHIHLPSGSVKKDGPSAGVAMVVAVVSLMRGIKCLPVAMTGEINLSGSVLPVGGIKEKVIGAHRAGIRTLLLPKKNETDVLNDLTPSIRSELNIVFVQSIWEALEGAFGKQLWEGEAGARLRLVGEGVESRL